MTQGIDVTVYPVSDLAQAKTLFHTLLGVDPYADQPYYVGFRAGGQEIGLDPYGHSKGITGPIVYVSVSNIQSSLNQLLQRLAEVLSHIHLALGERIWANLGSIFPSTAIETGAQPVQPVQDVGGGKLIASVKDSDGNNIGLIQNP